jgi:hypothetical protein
MLFSKKFVPDGYYVYMYLREDLTPYYIGKGKKARAWDKNHCIAVPKDNSHIIITHWNLTEIWAIAMERWLIRWYGRKDLSNGILRNKTDGGEGAPNLSDETKHKHKVKTKAAMNNPTMYKRLSDAQKKAKNKPHARKINSDAQKIAQNRPDVVEKKRNASLLSQNKPEVKAKKSGRNHYRYDPTILIFVHKDGTIEKMPANDFSIKHNLDRGWLSNVIRGIRPTIKGWSVSKT